MIDPIVRVAVVFDCAELARLESLARGGIADVRGGALRLQECQQVDDWAALVDDPDSRVFVGEIDAVVVAYAVLRLDAQRDRGIISHAYVEIEARELGFGDTMIEFAIAAVRGAGLTGIEATALPGDRDTKNLFERAGLTARKLTVYKSLGNSSE